MSGLFAAWEYYSENQETGKLLENSLPSQRRGREKVFRSGVCSEERNNTGKRELT